MTKTNPRGAVLATYRFGGTGTDTPSAIKVDAQGEAVIAGTTTSTDFPVTVSLVPAIQNAAAFVVKLNSGLTGIVASTLLGGSQYAQSFMGIGTVGGPLDVDSAGNVYLGGYTAALDFPVTAGAYQTTPPEVSAIVGSATLGFVAELSPGLNRIIFATYYGSSGAAGCYSGSCYAEHMGFTNITALAVNPSGTVAASAYIAGFGEYMGGSTIVEFAPGGGSVLWTTPINPQQYGPMPEQNVNALALDSGGDVVVVGSARYGAATTAGALQPCNAGGFVAKLAGSSGAIQFLTGFGCGDNMNYAPLVNAVAIDASGTIWVTGLAYGSTLPAAAISDGSGASYVASLEADGSSVQALYMAGDGMFGGALALTAAGNPVVTGSTGFLMLANSAGGPSLLGVANSAASAASSVVAPAEFVSLYGSGLGPATALGAQVVNGVVANTLGGYQLVIGGVAAPLLYMGAGQINAIVPIEASGRDSVSVTLVTPGGSFPLADLAIRPSEPEIFHDPASGYAAAINQDGTLNSAANPAHVGQLVSIWASGAGAMEGNPYPVVDGMIVVPGPGYTSLLPVLPVSMFGGNGGLEVDYAGYAPDEVYGLLQVNFRIPQGLIGSAGGMAVSLQVGAAVSASVGIYVAP